MARYIFILHCGQEALDRVEEELSTNDEAMERAKRLAHGHDVDIWNEGLLVGSVTAGNLPAAHEWASRALG
jgi:hypothetical protein